MWKTEWLENGEIHVHPLDDLRPHDLSSECWCRPFFRDGCEVHNSADEREKFERRERKPS